MDHIAGKTVVITGASRGIGAATARHLAGLNARVVLAARDADALAALAEETGGLAVPCDVADYACLLYTSPSPRDLSTSRMPSSA